MKIFNFQILFFLFLLFINSFIDCQINISPPTTSYKSYSKSNGKCTFDYFYILINNLDSYTLSGAWVKSRVVNDTATVIEIDAQEVDIGTRTISVDSTLNFEIECLEFDYNFSFKRLDYLVRPTLLGEVSYHLIYELTSSISLDYGALKNLPFYFATCNNLECTLAYDYHRYFRLVIRMSNDIENFIDKPIYMVIDGHTFELEPFLTSQYDQIEILNLYQLQFIFKNLTTFGYGETAVVSFKSNSTVFQKPYISKFFTNSNFQYYPVSGDENSTTFLFALPVYDQSFTCDLFYQSGSSFVPQSPQIISFINSYKLESLLPESGFIYSELPEGPTLDIGFTLNKGYLHDAVEMAIHGSTTFFKFPYGFLKKLSSTQFEYSVTTLIKAFSDEPNTLYIASPNEDHPNVIFTGTGQYVKENAPKITNIEKIHLFGDRWLLRIYASLFYQFGKIIIYPLKRIGVESKVGRNDIFEVVVPSIDSSFALYDIYDGSAPYSNGQMLSGSGLGSFYTYPALLKGQFDVYSIKNVKFLYNNINVTNHRHYNILYFNYTDIPRDTAIVMEVLDAAIQQNLISDPQVKLNNEPFYAVYDYSLQLFKIEFYVEPNTQYGEFQFSLSIGGLYSLYHSSISEKLIIKTTRMDLQGPIITGFSALSGNFITETNRVGSSKWSFTIEDSINGFDWGYIVYRGTVDQSVYNFTFKASDAYEGDMYKGIYSFVINETFPCVSQSLVLNEVVLYDRVKRVSVYNTFVKNPKVSGVMNPFLNLLGSDLYKRSVLCSPSSDNVISKDSTPPVLVSFNASTYQIDSSIPNVIDFQFIAEDLESGLKTNQNQNPIVYLSTCYNRVLECKSDIIEYLGPVDTPNKRVKYQCSIEIPIDFGNVDGILLSVYGFINRNGLYSGYSTTKLKESEHNYFISSSYQNSNKILFLSHFRISEKGGDLWIQGRNLDLVNQVTIDYDDGSRQQIKPNNVSFTIFRLSRLRATKNSYKIYTADSNTLQIIPTVFDYYLNPNDEPSSSSSFDSSSNEPLPTNPPSKCLGSPVCGGPSHGKCIENQGCYCYSPWVGVDCLSQIVIVDPPVFNNGSSNNSTSPSIEIIIPENTNNSSNTVVKYSTLISIVALNEINIIGETVYSASLIDNWISKQIDTLEYEFYTDLNITKNGITTTTSIIATLKWFINETTIRFANEDLVMNPSSLKYTVKINKYPFSSDLNQLQLIMSALIQSNTTDNVCSVREFGDTTTGDNSNYLKIQVDNHSLYGRFIKRGIVDSKIRSLSNVLLDKDMNPITSTKQLQSFIGIQIPNFKNNIILDPDFSILVDSYTASSKSNSICSNKSKLTGAKIAGIVVGCVAFVAVVTVAVSYHIIKKKKNSKFISNMNQKMKQMN